MVHGLETMKRLNREQFERTVETQPKYKMLTIAIDFDDTFTTDPVLWTSVIALLAVRHQVICVTSRRVSIPNVNALQRALTPHVAEIIYAYDQPKRLAAQEAGYAVDIWIDDRPETIATKEECLALVG